MANTFKNYVSSGVGTSPTTTYTVPASTTAILLGANLANTTTSQIIVSVDISGTDIIKDAPIPAGASLGILDGKMIAETTETINVVSDTAASLDVVLSVMEQS